MSDLSKTSSCDQKSKEGEPQSVPPFLSIQAIQLNLADVPLLVRSLDEKPVIVSSSVNRAAVKRKFCPMAFTHQWVLRVLLFFVSLPLILYLGFALAMQFVDFNQYKPWVEQTFLEHTDYPLEIKGELRVQVLPFAVEVGEMQINNPDSFTSDTPLLKLEGALFELSLWDLFVSRQVNLLGLELNRPHFNLQRLANQQINWQGLKDWLSHLFVARQGGLGAQSGFQAVNLQSIDSSLALLQLENWSLKTLVVRNAQVSYQDDYAHQGFMAEKVTMLALDLKPNQPFEFMLEADYKADQAPIHWYFNGNMQASMNLDLTDIQLKEVLGFVKLKLDESFNVPDIRLNLTGQLGHWQRDVGLIELQQFQLRSLNSQLTFDIKNNLADPTRPIWSGKLQAEGLNLQKWLRHIGTRLPNFVNQLVLTNVNGQFNWEWSPVNFALNDIHLNWDESTLTGHLWQKNSKDTDQVQTHFDLQVDQINLDAYHAVASHQMEQQAVEQAQMPLRESSNPSDVSELTQSLNNPIDYPELEGNEKTVGPVLSQGYFPLALPIEFLRQANLSGQLTLGQLTAWGLNFSAVDLTLDAQSGVWQFAPLDASLYQGKLSSKLVLDVTQQTPNYHWKGVLEDVEAYPLLKNGWQYQSLSGQLNTRFNLATQGINSGLLKQNLQGNFFAEIQKGAFSGVNFDRLLGQPKAKFRALKLRNLTLNSQIKQGLLKFKRFNVDSNRMSAIGTGQFELAKDRIDLTLFSRWQKPPAGLDALKKVELPLRMKGPLDRPRWSVTIDRLQPKKSREAIRALLDAKP